MDLQEITNLVRQHVMFKARVDDLNSQHSDVKNKLTEAIEELGETDDKGHIVVEINDETSGVGRAMRQRRVSKVLDIEIAEELLKERGIHERCITMVPVLNEDEIMAAYYDGAITEEDIDKMFPSKVTWALVIK